MIIFDLDGSLANCEHRRHYVQKPWDHCSDCYSLLINNDPTHPNCHCGRNPFTWKEDWKAFFEACDKDTPIEPVINVFRHIRFTFPECEEIQIWSGRCESVRDKTEDWIIKNIGLPDYLLPIKMRPIGDNSPDDKLKEKWLDETISQGKTIEFVFDDRPKVVRMWRRRGIFVFDVNQVGIEF